MSVEHFHCPPLMEHPPHQLLLAQNPAAAAVIRKWSSSRSQSRKRRRAPRRAWDHTFNADEPFEEEFEQQGPASVGLSLVPRYAPPSPKARHKRSPKKPPQVAPRAESRSELCSCCQVAAKPEWDHNFGKLVSLAPALVPLSHWHGVADPQRQGAQPLPQLLRCSRRNPVPNPNPKMR
jgi:hypothetical protein